MGFEEKDYVQAARIVRSSLERDQDQQLRNTQLDLKIMVAGLDTLTKREAYICMEALEELMEKLLVEQVEQSVEMQKAKEDTISKLKACFPEPIYVKELKNEYCSKHCCLHKPWLSVTTKRGVFKIGWRKSVISLDWTDSEIEETAEMLFPDEDVTKAGFLMHAWNYEDAARYVARILETR